MCSNYLFDIVPFIPCHGQDIRKRRQTKKIVIREASEEATSTNEFRPISPSFSKVTTSAKKLEAFGLTLESMQDEIVGMESHVREDNCFLIVSKQV